MDIDVKLINELRKRTGSGVMSCKKALIESDGDIEKAIDYLRKSGVKVANKRSDCKTEEGIVLAAVDDCNKFGAVVTLLCETDFVAKSDMVKTLVGDIVKIATTNKITDINVLKLSRTSEGLTVDEKIIDVIGKVGEKIELKYDYLEGEIIALYNHFSGKLSVLVSFQNCCDASVMKNISMHIAAMNPLALDRDGVAKDIIDREMDIAKEQSQGAKNDVIAEKMAKGKLEKFFKESVLLEQGFIRDEKISVGQYLEKNGSPVVVEFKRIKIGE